MAVTKKPATTAKTVTNAKVDDATTKAPRKPRVPKPVTDLSTANAAFQKAKKAAERANVAAAEATAAAQGANEKLAEAARVLKGYTAELDAAVAGVLPTEAEDAPEVTPQEDADEYPPVTGWNETNTDPAGPDDNA
jgi:hypothetical protein